MPQTVPDLEFIEPDRETSLSMDAEVRAMQEVSRALEPLDLAARRRVLKWALDRHVNTLARGEIEERQRGECA